MDEDGLTVVVIEGDSFSGVVVEQIEMFCLFGLNCREEANRYDGYYELHVV